MRRDVMGVGMSLTTWLGRRAGELVGSYQSRVKELTSGERMGLDLWQMRQGSSAPQQVTSPIEDEARYSTSDDVFAAVNLLAENAGAVPLRVFVNDEEAPDHDLQVLLDRGNADIGPEWRQWAYSWLWLTGEVFCYVRHASGAYHGLPTELYPMSGQHWVVKPAGPREVMARRYLHIPPGKSAANAVPVAPGECGMAALFNPHDALRGLSPLSALRLGLDAERAANSSNRDMFTRGMAIDSIISVPGATDVQRQRLQEDMKAKHVGMGRRHGTLVVNTDMSVEPLALTPRDAEFIELQRMTTRDVAKAYGIPPMFLGDLTDATYSNYDTAWRALWELAIMPKVRLLASSLTTLLSWQYADEPVIRPDTSTLSALQDNAKEQAETVKLLKDAGWDAAEAAKFVYGEDKVSEVIFVEPEPVQVVAQPMPQSQAPAKREKADTRELGQMLRAAQGALMPAARRDVDAALQAQADAILAAVDRLDPEKADGDGISAVLGGAVDSEALMAGLYRVWDSSCKGGASATATVGGFELRMGGVDAHTARFIGATSAERVVLVNDTTKQLIRQAVSDAYAAGEGIKGVRKRVAEAFGRSDEPDKVLMYDGRVENIAQTESSRAFNDGSVFAMKDAGVEWHEWASSGLPGSRHGGVDGQRVKVGEMFDVRGHRGRYPSAEELPPGEACNCKCVTIPVDGPGDSQ